MREFAATRFNYRLRNNRNWSDSRPKALTTTSAAQRLPHVWQNRHDPPRPCEVTAQSVEANCH